MLLSGAKDISHKKSTKTAKVGKKHKEIQSHYAESHGNMSHETHGRCNYWTWQYQFTLLPQPSPSTELIKPGVSSPRCCDSGLVMPGQTTVFWSTHLSTSTCLTIQKASSLPQEKPFPSQIHFLSCLRKKNIYLLKLTNRNSLKMWRKKHC